MEDLQDEKRDPELAQDLIYYNRTATEAMHLRIGAVAISYLGTVLLQLVAEGVVSCS